MYQLLNSLHFITYLEPIEQVMNNLSINMDLYYIILTMAYNFYLLRNLNQIIRNYIFYFGYQILYYPS